MSRRLSRRFCFPWDINKGVHCCQALVDGVAPRLHLAAPSSHVRRGQASGTRRVPTPSSLGVGMAAAQPFPPTRDAVPPPARPPGGQFIFDKMAHFCLN
jgi:hypothetical protein